MRIGRCPDLKIYKSDILRVTFKRGGGFSVRQRGIIKFNCPASSIYDAGLNRRQTLWYRPTLLVGQIPLGEVFKVNNDR